MYTLTIEGFNMESDHDVGSLSLSNLDDKTLARMFYDLRIYNPEEYKLMKSIIKILACNNKLQLLTNFRNK